MPHIHLQTTADLPENTDIADILEALVKALCEVETVSPPAVKAYHSLRSVWAMGEGAPPGFASLTVSILAGRPEELRIKMADHMYAALQKAFDQSRQANEVSLTLEIREMDKPTYRK